ncbi:hypothetical protein [Bacillus marinisedimentorum]|uniref:hypothetical protein n=1 Tax=Bacillus marinisedimentorum TaxID=1821260 RepID=UPI00087229BE|nr:hypothetical protein [Bacillus marinisedimentorum]
MALETAEVKKQIQKHKKLLETYELFPYSYRHEGVDYCFVLYFRFKKPNAVLTVKKDGELPPVHVAKEVSKQVLSYNSIMRNGEQFLRYKDHDVWMFEEAVREIEVLLKDMDGEAQSIKQDYGAYYELKNMMVSSKTELNRLWDEMKELDAAINQKSLLTEKDTRSMLELSGEFSEILYRRGTNIIKKVDAIENLINFFEQHKDQFRKTKQDSYNKLIRLLKDNIRPDILSDLKKSLATFELDIHGNPVTFSSGEEGVKEMREMSDRKMEYEAEMSVKKFLRGA